MEIMDNSEVMTEFYKIAMAKDAEKPVIEVDEDLIEDAHPEPVYVADAQGTGGLVENQNEQHKKMVEVAQKMPTGQYIHTYASCAIDLIKLAEECDKAGEQEAAEIITIMAEKLLEQIPFVQAPAIG